MAFLTGTGEVGAPGYISRCYGSLTTLMSRPTPPELVGEQGAADAIVSGVVD